jgi:hypothetical protein
MGDGADITPILENAVAAGIAVAMGLMGARHAELIVRLDRDGEFLGRVSAFVTQNWLADSATDGGVTREKFRAMLDAIQQMHEGAPPS